MVTCDLTFNLYFKVVFKRVFVVLEELILLYNVIFQDNWW